MSDNEARLDDDIHSDLEISEDGDTMDVEQQDENSLSALRENISRKGKNSYYYAHSQKIDGPEWDGKEEPRKLDVNVQFPLKSTTILPSQSITEYSWLDEKAHVKIYIDHPNVDAIADSDITLASTNNSIDFRYKASDKEYNLVISTLQDSIEKASFKKKNNKFVLTLKKLKETTWITLKRGSS